MMMKMTRYLLTYGRKLAGLSSGEILIYLLYTYIHVFACTCTWKLIVGV